ncbi:hypothetical protein FN846DRAFT_894855 [Sphaerosporella brunnea]|uniref:Uncharacterized protein n=1 Tax=Sphaerosporella brunnea TaxID=1250544 RepID=A0A5J5EHH9_9PEZI|nr:hypothetical protein FN846DRAFT_894855 [Sphaerosporella brunnea]
MQLPHFAYIGYAAINYTLINAGNPSNTPRGVSYYDTFNSGVLTFLPETSLYTPLPGYVTDTGPIPTNLSTTSVRLVDGGDYFKFLAPSTLALDSTAAGFSEAGNLVHFRAAGFIRIQDSLSMILQGKGNGSMKFGETDFWEPITVDTGDAALKWLNFRVIISQGRVLVDKGKAYGIELRLWSPVN